MYRGDALVRGDVRQQQTADQVADRIEVRLRGAHPRVDRSRSPSRPWLASISSPIAFRDRRAAGGDEHLLGAQLLGLLPVLADHEADARLVDVDGARVEARVGHDLHAASLERPLELLRDVGVLERRQARQVLEQRDLDAGVVVEAGELDPDRAAADDDDALGQRVAGRGLVDW